MASGLETIAERIAERGFAVLPRFVSAPEAALWSQEAMASFQAGEFHRAGIGRGERHRVLSEVREDYVRWLDPPGRSASERGYFALMEELRRTLNRVLTLGLFGLEAHLTLYPKGARYRCHLDRFENDDSRVLSASLYLNPEWRSEEEGALRLYLERPGAEPFEDVLPEAGTLVLFLSERFYHEVLPGQRERLAATGWFRRRLAQPIP